MIAAMVINHYAQQRDIQPLMREVQPAFGAMTKGIAAGTADTVAAEATKLQGLFREVAGWMKTQKADKAVGWSNDTATLAGEVAKAAKANDMAAAKASGDKIKAQCKACHDVHREQLPDKTFKYKAP
jgi:hypothetical protein